MGRGENDCLIETGGQFGKMTMSGLRGQPLATGTGQGTWTRCSGGMTPGRPAVQKGTDVQKGTQVGGGGEGGGRGP